MGVDIIKNSSMKGILDKPSRDRFIAKVYHQNEIDLINQYIRDQNDKRLLEYMSSRWAAKESLVKASRRKDLVYSSILVSSHEDGCPYYTFDAHTLTILKSIDIRESILSISHDDDYSVAMCILYS